MYALNTFYMLRLPTPAVQFIHEKNIKRMRKERHVERISPRVTVTPCGLTHPFVVGEARLGQLNPRVDQEESGIFWW